MKLYVARHGQTVWNAQNKVCGITDVELTEKGIEQAEELASILPEDIDIIVTSPLRDRKNYLLNKITGYTKVLTEKILNF